MKENKLIKYLFILTIIIFCIGIGCGTNIPDNDLWARLFAGGYIFENLKIMKHDIFSYTPTHIWYDHEWGASVIFYSALKYFGEKGLIILKGILSAATILLCYKTVELRKPKSTISYNIIYFVLMFTAVYKLLGEVVRCLLFTCLFFALFLYILERARQEKNKSLIFLPIIMIFWSNIHGGCLSGLGLIVLYIIGEYLNKKPVKKYIITLIFCICALFINPYGIEYVKFLLSAGLMNREYITEWASPFSKKYLFDYLSYKYYLIVMIITQIVYLIKYRTGYKNIDKTKLLIILTVTYISITHLRHQTFFIFTAGTLLYDEFYTLFNSLIKFFAKKIRPDSEEIKNNIVLLKEITVYFLLIIIGFSRLTDIQKMRITETKYPRYAVQFIKDNNIKGNLFVDFSWGSYCIYKLFPNNLIAMDGRYEEVYNPDLLNDFKNFHLVQNDWSKVIRDFKTDVMIIEKKYPIYKKLLTIKEWKQVFDNNVFAVFLPTDKVKEEYIYPIVNDEYYNQTIFHTDIEYMKIKD